jgi:hypothetical protein
MLCIPAAAGWAWPAILTHLEQRRPPARVLGFFLNLTFATRNPLNRLAHENPSKVLIFAHQARQAGLGCKGRLKVSARCSVALRRPSRYK